MYGRIALWVFVCGLIASACVFCAAELLFSRIYDESKAFFVREAEGRLELFNLILSRTERDTFENGRKALLELGRRYPSGRELGELGAEGLGREAERLGVSELYLIDSGGKVVASSLRSDVGLDLFKISKKFTAFLQGLYGAGVVANQGFSLATKGGAVSAYQYFGPPGSAYLIEVSTRIEEALPRSTPGLGYDDLVAKVFGVSDQVATKSIARIVDLISVQPKSIWSLFRRGELDRVYAPIIARVRSEGAGTEERVGASVVLVKQLRGRRVGEDFDTGAYYAVFEFNLRPLLIFRLAALASVLGACTLACALSLAALKRSFDKSVVVRIERLRSDIAKAAGGDYCLDFEGYGEDEIGAIGASVKSMVRTLRDEKERLSAAARMETIGAMAGGLAHDFSNVLTGIKGTIECMELDLESGATDSDKLRDLISVASRTASRGESLVKSLFDLAQPAAAAEGELVDLGDVAREAADLARGKGGGEVAIRVEAPAEPISVRGDGQAILRAALNLCVNGIQAMTSMRPEGEARGGLLVVRAEARPGDGSGHREAAIVVKDQGVGIAPEDQGKILAPFYSTKPRGIGSGIGLAVVLSVASRHGGRVEIESRPGAGSAFSLVLPAQG